MFNSGYQLKVVQGPEYGRVYTLQEPEISLGRAHNAAEESTPNALYFQEKTVSRLHAKLVWDDVHAFFKIRHLSKTNQTKINNQVISEKILEIGDHLVMGKLTLEVQKAPKADHLREVPLDVDLCLPLAAPATVPLAASESPLIRAALPDNLAGRRLGPYILQRELGRGSVGIVYLAQHVTYKTVAAIKILSPEVTRDPNFLNRFKTEARVASILRHPNIIQVSDISLSDGLVYLVMEYLGARTLQALFDESNGPLPLHRTVRIIEQLLCALDHAHSFGIVHRDVKPANILIDESKDTVALTDFSIAKVKDGVRQTTAGVVLGTVEYMAPELFEGQSANPRIDLYAVGVILYELLTGVLPFKGKTNTEIITAQLLHMPAHPRIYNPDLPDGLVQIAYVALQKNPQNRFATAAEMRDSLLAHAFT